MANSPYLTDQAVLGASPEVVGLERQRRLADLLTSQAFQSPQGQMISGQYVKPAITQQIQPLLGALLGSYMNRSLDEKQVQLAAALRGEQTKAVEDYMAAMQGQNVALPQQQGPMPTGGNIPIQVQNTGPNYGAAFKAATRPGAPASLQTMGYDLLKPITTKEGETISMRNFGPGGGTTELASGGEKQTDMIRNYNKAVAQGYKGSLMNYELALKQAGASKFDFSNMLGKGNIGEISPMLKESKAGAISAIEQADAANKILNALATGNAITGPAANQRLAINQVGTMLGVTGNDNEKAVKSREIIQGLAQLTLVGRRGMKGQGAMDKMEGELANQVISGKIDFTPAELAMLANGAKKSAKNQYKQHENMMESLRQDEPRSARYFEVPVNPSIFESNQQSATPVRSNTVNEALSIIQGR
jgi:hypothetical protein